jgi:hypothetical protein
MPFPSDAPGKIRAKVEDGRLPLELPARMWAGFGSEKPCDGCGEAISRSQVEYEFESRDGCTIRLHLGCASLLEAERRRRSSP